MTWQQHSRIGSVQSGRPRAHARGPRKRSSRVRHTAAAVLGPSALPALAGLAGLLLALTGCASFGAEDAASDTVQQNGCSTDADCGEGARCGSEFICVARSAEEQNIVLLVTSAYLPDGSEPLPAKLELPRIDGPTARELTLPRPVRVKVRAFDDDGPVAVEVRIRDADQLLGMPSRTLTASLAKDQDEAEVLLNEGGRYVARAEPRDPTRAPMTLMIDGAGDDEVLEFDYGQPMVDREYEVTGHEGGPLYVRAVDPDSRRALSSMAETDSDGVVTLAFADSEVPYVLELSPSPDTAPVAGLAANDSACSSGPATPSYQIASEDMVVEEGRIQVQLPQVLPAVRYGGTVELCGSEAAVLSGDNVSTLSVSLRSTQLQLEAAPEPDSATATYVVEATATLDSKTGAYRFCAQALPGQYDVVVNPPAITGSCQPEQSVARCGCGIFAESRPVGAEQEEEVTLTLPTMASISGSLTTEGSDPVPGATIEAIARAMSDGINLSDTDRGVTSYNRSRQSTSDQQGSFRLPLDVGAYDVTVKPPSESGFAWLVVRDLRIADRTKEFSQTLTMGAPITLDGSLRQSGDGDEAALSGAVIRAYVIEEPSGAASRRAIQIGQATADESGHFMLLISKNQHEGWFFP